MRVTEFGAGNRDTVVFLHGGGLGPWNFETEARFLAQNCRVLLPVLDGHAGSGDSFSSIAECAQRLINYIDNHCGGRVKALCGLSLGAQVAAEMLAQRGDICEYAVLESASVVPARLTAAIVAPAFRMSFGLIKKRWFSKLQFRYLRIRDDLFSTYYKDTCALTCDNLVAFTEASALYSLPQGLERCAARVEVVLGAREQRGIKRSAELLHKALPNSTLRVMPRLHHGEYALNHPERYAAHLLEMISEQ